MDIFIKQLYRNPEQVRDDNKKGKTPWDDMNKNP